MNKSVIFFIAILTISLSLSVYSKVANKNFLANNEKHKKNAMKKGWWDDAKKAASDAWNKAVDTVKGGAAKAAESAKEAAGKAVESGKEAAGKAVEAGKGAIAGVIPK